MIDTDLKEEIQISPAMIQAGEFAVHEGLSGTPELPALFDAALFAKKVFLAMERIRSADKLLDTPISP